MGSLYDVLLAYLTTNWNITAETDPVFKNYKKVNTDTWTENVVGIEVLKELNEYKTTSKIYSINTPFKLHCMCKTEALRDKYIIEIRRLMKAQEAIVGWWVITSVDWNDTDNFSYTKVTCMEKRLE